MKKIVFLIALLNLFGAYGFAQEAKVPLKTPAPPMQTPKVSELAAAEWKTLTDALQTENWTKAAALAADYLQKLKTDNDKKQIAQLRYIRLYALSGKILVAANIPAETDALWRELDDAASEFSGREFVLPPRRYLRQCRKVANYICPVADNERALRVTATNKTGTAIHSFDYVVFDDKNSLTDLSESELFLGGNLKKVEYNQDSTKPWVMRLIFEKGFVSVVSAINK